jgi:hypothetical protein
MFGYLSIRLILWIIGVFISLFPTLHTVGIDDLSFNPHESEPIREV